VVKWLHDTMPRTDKANGQVRPANMHCQYNVNSLVTKLLQMGIKQNRSNKFSISRQLNFQISLFQSWIRGVDYQLTKIMYTKLFQLIWKVNK